MADAMQDLRWGTSVLNFHILYMEVMEVFHILFGISKTSTYFSSTYILGAQRGRWNQTEWDQGRIRDRNRPEGAII